VTEDEVGYGRKLDEPQRPDARKHAPPVLEEHGVSNPKKRLMKFGCGRVGSVHRVVDRREPMLVISLKSRY